jgi:hypothetical protein
MRGPRVNESEGLMRRIGRLPGYAGVLVFLPLCYWVLRWLLQLVALRGRANDFKELEIVVLRHELAILRRQTGRPAMMTVDRLLLAAASRLLPRERASLHHHAGHTASVASASGGEALDVCACGRSPGDAA